MPAARRIIGGQTEVDLDAQDERADTGVCRREHEHVTAAVASGQQLPSRRQSGRGGDEVLVASPRVHAVVNGPPAVRSKVSMASMVASRLFGSNCAGENAAVSTPGCK